MAADPTDVSDDRSGDRAPEAVAVQELYERHAARVYSFCLHQLGNREEAEDATQSTFLNAFRGLRRGVAPVAETAWLLAIARNVCLTRVRSTVRRRRLEAPRDLHTLQDTLPARAAAGGDELLWLGDALSGLPENQRRAILLREWQGLSYDEIAADLGTTHGAVETLIFRGRRTLAQRLEVAPRRRRVPLRVARWLDFGAAAGWFKALLAGGAAKAVATASVVATVAVAGSAPVRHDEPPAAASAAPPSGTRTIASAPPAAWAVLTAKASNAPVRVTAKRVGAVRRSKPTPTRGGSAPPPPPPTNGRRSAGPLAADETSETRTESPTRPRRPLPRVRERDQKPTEKPEQANDNPPPAPPPATPPESKTEPVDEGTKDKKEKKERPDRERERDNDDEREEGEDVDEDEDDDDDEDDERSGRGRP